MTSPALRIQVENATSLDWLEFKKEFGDEVLERPETPDGSGVLPPFNEPVSVTIILTIAAVTASAAFAAWVLKQRKLHRTTLKITTTHPDGTVVAIDLSDKTYYEGKGDTKLLSDLVKAGLKAAQG
jgi:hypothetical protein